MKLSLLSALVPVLAGVVSLASPAQAQIVNGGFETPVAPSGAFIQVPAGSGALTGWSVGGSDVLVINSSYNEIGGTMVFNAQSGNQALDITGAGNTGPNTISQAFATTPGQSYSLSFFLGNAQQTNGIAPYALPSSVSLVATGNPLQSFTNAATTPGFVNWAQQSYNFTAAGASTTITFTNTTVGDNYAGLDNIVLAAAAVPEPASLAVWGAVSALGAAFGWRRRRMS